MAALITKVVFLGLSFASGSALAYDPGIPPNILAGGLSLTWSEFNGKISSGISAEVVYTYVPYFFGWGWPGAGTFVRISWQDFKHGRFTAGAHAGYSFLGALGFDGEVGYSFGFAKLPGPNGIQLGGNLNILMLNIAKGKIGYISPNSEGVESYTNFGIRYPGTFGRAQIFSRPLERPE